MYCNSVFPTLEMLGQAWMFLLLFLLYGFTLETITLEILDRLFY